MQIEEFNIKIPNKLIAAVACGPTNAKPILALHGWLDNAASFIPLAAHMPDFRLIAIDFQGHGLSEHAPAGCYFHFEDYIADVINIIDSLGLQQCSLLGHSLGAGIASIVAGVIPERITALGLIDGIGPISINEDQMPEMMRKSINEYAKLAEKKLTLYANKDDAIKARLSASKIQKSSVELLVSRGLKDTGKGFIWRTDPRLMLKPLALFVESQISAFLKNISAKTCLLRPSPGWPFDENLFTSRIHFLKDIEVHRIPGDHHIHMDNPAVVAPILNEFFKRSIR